MKYLFVTYKVALKLKELGFDNKCLYPYNKDGDLIFESMQKTWQNFNQTYFDSSLVNWISCSAPLWQQAIDFLKMKGILVSEQWDGWDVGIDDFVWYEDKEEAVLKALESA